MEMAKELLLTLAQAIIVAVVPILTKYAVDFLRAQIEQAKAGINNDLARLYLDEAGEAVLQAVTFTSQTYVEELKKHGQFDKDAQIQAFNTTKELATKLITEEAQRIIINLYGDLTVWLETKIEQTVNEQKAFSAARIGRAVSN